MGPMKSKRNVLTEEEIDQKVTAEADDASVWESPYKVLFEAKNDDIDPKNTCFWDDKT